jgi:ubiquinone/menaquinone biosynthesis C-methylase UbiE
MNPEKPPVIDYEGSDYQTSFWEQGGREYEDLVEEGAISDLLPDRGELLLEVGAGAGRNTQRYKGYKQIVLLDYSLTQLKQARERLGGGARFTFVAGDVYHLPFVSSLFDGATMIRTLHHMQQPALALGEIRRVMQTHSPFLLEYANKQNLKAILRFLLGRQDWNPFSPEPVEFVELNFDFHPRFIRELLKENQFQIEEQLTVSHFRVAILKKTIPTGVLVFLDRLAQRTGNLWQLSPSVFVRTMTAGKSQQSPAGVFFQCPNCGTALRDREESGLRCTECDAHYPIEDGIYDFRSAV